MSGKALRTEETWEIVEDLREAVSDALDEGRGHARQLEQYRTALRFHSWPHEIPAPKPNDRSTKEGPCPTRE